MEEWKKETAECWFRDSEGISKFMHLLKVLVNLWKRYVFNVFSELTCFYASLTDFTDFRVLTSILHVLCVLTHKIGRFYELKRIFNNHNPLLLSLVLQPNPLKLESNKFNIIINIKIKIICIINIIIFIIINKIEKISLILKNNHRFDLKGKINNNNNNNNNNNYYYYYYYYYY